MTFTTWFLFLVTEIALAIVPGPAVLFVVGTGLRHGLKPSIGANLGVLSGNTVYFIASALGLGLVLAQAKPVFVALKWLGAAYLVWLGVQAIRASYATPIGRSREGGNPVPSAPGQDTALQDDASKALDSRLRGNDGDGVRGDDEAAGRDDAAVSDLAVLRDDAVVRTDARGFATLTPIAAWRAAFALQLGNPKAIIFFTALVPQFIRPDSAMPIATQIGILGVTSIVPEFFVLLGYGALAARAARAARDPRMLRWFDRASGACLIGCAALALAA